MYDSGMTAAALIQAVREEADIGIVIPDASWYRWINTVEQFLYAEIIEEIVSASVDAQDMVDGTTLPLASIPAVPGADACIYDDVVRVYADETELERSSAAAMRVFTDKPMYGTDYAGNLLLHTVNEPGEIVVFRRLRPVLKEVGGNTNIAIPVEHIELLASRMRAEAYKLANEDGLAAKWAADYNNYVENFRVWATRRNMSYGRG